MNNTDIDIWLSDEAHAAAKKQKMKFMYAFINEAVNNTLNQPLSEDDVKRIKYYYKDFRTHKVNDRGRIVCNKRCYLKREFCEGSYALAKLASTKCNVTVSAIIDFCIRKELKIKSE